MGGWAPTADNEATNAVMYPTFKSRLEPALTASRAGCERASSSFGTKPLTCDTTVRMSGLRILGTSTNTTIKAASAARTNSKPVLGTSFAGLMPAG